MASSSNQDLLRTTLVFKMGQHLIKDYIEIDEEHPEDFDLFAEVQAGRLTMINERFQRMQRKMKPEEIQAFVNRKDEDGKTPLFYACYYNYQNIILYLLTKGADPFIVDKKGRNCFHILAFKGLSDCIIIILNYLRHIIRKQALALLKKYKKQYGFLKSDIKKGVLVSPNQSLASVKENFANFMPIAERIFKEEYLDQIFRVQERAIAQFDELARSAVHYAAMSKYTRCFICNQLLLINKYNKLEGYDEFEKLFDELQFLELNIDKREETKSATQFLELMENLLSPETSHSLIDGFDQRVHHLQEKVINSQDNDGYTPMHLASFYGDFLAVQFMLRLGGNEHIRDRRDNKQVLDYAANGLVRGVLIDLKEAARKGDEKSFDFLLNCGNKIDERKTIYNIAPVHNAVQQVFKTKKQDMLDFIIKCGANLDMNDASGWSPLHHACQNGDLDTVENLVRNEANIHAFSNKHFYPLHIAALNNHPAVIEFLVKNHANLECKNDEGCTPLHLASRKGHCESMKTLLDLGADIYAVDIRKWTALHFASYNGYQIYYRINLLGHGKAVQLLCKYDADYEKLREMKNTADKIAKEIAPDANVKFQFNTLWKAAFDGNLDIVRRLHRFGEDIDEQTRKLRLTPLIIATKRHHLLVVKYLLDNGANREIRDTEGKTAYDYAVAAKNLIKVDKFGQRVIDESKATKNEYYLDKNKHRVFYPDLVHRIEKTLKLFE